MTKFRACFAALLLLLGTARGLDHSAVVKRSVLSNEAAQDTETEAGFGTVALSSRTPNVSLSSEKRRRLLHSVGECGFDYAKFECSVGLNFTLDLLGEADNPVATYVSNVITCNQFNDPSTCAQNNCLWLGVYCTETADDYRALHNTPCAKDASKIVEEIARSMECLGLTDRTSCEGRETCHWRASGCGMDQWKFHYDIPTLPSGNPEGLHKLVERRRKKFTDYLVKIYDGTDAESSLNEILQSPLPAVRCPRDVPSILCKSADAIASDAQPAVYCQLKHRSRRACNADDRCQASSSGDAECTASSNEVDKAVRRAKDVFDDNIKPVYMRRLVKKRTTCTRIRSEAECNGQCVWRASGCALSYLEELLSFYIQVSDHDDAVCKFIALDLTSGCSRNTNEEKCSGAMRCAWDAHLTSCNARLVELVATALEAPPLEVKFRTAAQKCEASGSLISCASASSNGEGSSGLTISWPSLAGVLGAVLVICTLIAMVARVVGIFHIWQWCNRSNHTASRYVELEEQVT